MSIFDQFALVHRWVHAFLFLSSVSWRGVKVKAKVLQSLAAYSWCLDFDQFRLYQMPVLIVSPDTGPSVSFDPLQ
jgi:hypothetical protein